MPSLQDWVYNVEAGPVRLWLVRVSLLLLVVGLSAFIGLREFNGLRTFEAMDLAQQARQLAEGKGFTTLCIRPLALWQIRANSGIESPPVSAFPETLTPPLLPATLAGLFKVGMLAKIIKFDLSPEAIRGFRIYPPDVVFLSMQLVLVVASTFLVYAWAHQQFDIGTGLLAAVFFFGSSPIWTKTIEGGGTILAVFLYALAGWLFSLGAMRQEDDDQSGVVCYFSAGLVFGAAMLVQVLHFWAALAAGGLACLILRHGRLVFVLGLVVGFAVFSGWLVRLYLITKNPVGLNWAFFLADSPYFPGETIWRTYSFDINKTDVWRRLGGSLLRGIADLLSRGPGLIGNTVAGTLALVGLLHVFRKPSAEAGRNLWSGVAAALILATAFVQRSGEEEGHPILMVLLPVACVYGAAYLWIIIERWKLHLELLGKIFATVVALVATGPLLTRVILPEPPPFAYPPTYPPIFLLMRSWFEPGELQASDLPAAEAWYAEQPTLWLPSTREDFLKIHDRVAPVFSILLTPKSSDTRMYSQMMAENSEWKEWADLIRRQKPPDLPQAFATSLPPNNDYLLLSIQKRWN